MKLAFDEVKATQAAALFLKLAGCPLNYVALIKLLYKADREAIRRFGLPITTDNYAAMKLGPVTSRIYDRIKTSAMPNAHPTFWAAHIQRSKDPHEVVLKRDPGNSELSKAEENLIAEIFAADGAKDRFELAGECHRDFPEWNDPGETSTPIDISDIVSALGLSEEEAAHVATLIEVQRAAFDLATQNVPFHAGQTYLFPLNDDTRRAHLWIIATEPDADGQFATASFTSLKGAKDQTVTFLKDEHPFIKWDTCILYSLAEITTTKTLQAYLDCGSAKMHQNAPAAMLRLILDGFAASDFTKNRVRQFIREYKRATQDPEAPK